ncbi:MAG: hypothetical protein NVSMB46_06000 [Candidatus Saccharimonadales bacterium]
MKSRNDLLQLLVTNLHGLYKGILSRKSSNAIPYGQKAALFSIATQKSTTIKQLSNQLRISSGATTQHIEALVQAGLVFREHDTLDRRNVNVRLSPDGNLLMKKLEHERITLMEQLCEDISVKELENFIEVIEKINKNLNLNGESQNK